MWSVSTTSSKLFIIQFDALLALLLLVYRKTNFEQVVRTFIINGILELMYNN